MNSFFNWVKSSATYLMGLMGLLGSGQRGEILPLTKPSSLADDPPPQPAGWSKTIANKLMSLGTAAKDIVVNATKAAVKTVTDGFNAVMKKASDIKGLVIAVGLTLFVFAFIFWPILSKLVWPILSKKGSFFRPNATKKSNKANDEENQNSGRHTPDSEVDEGIVIPHATQMQSGKGLASPLQVAEEEKLSANLDQAAQSIFTPNTDVRETGAAGLTNARSARFH